MDINIPPEGGEQLCSLQADGLSGGIGLASAKIIYLENYDTNNGEFVGFFHNSALRYFLSATIKYLILVCFPGFFHVDDFGAHTSGSLLAACGPV